MKSLVLSIVLGLALISGCGDDDASGGDDGGAHAPHDDAGGAGGADHDAGGGGNDDAGAGAGASKRITAAEGGELALGGAAVAIPAGALAADATITIDEVPTAALPDAADIASAAYELGPDGTTFEAPVTLTFDFDGEVPEGEQAVLAWLDGDTWQPLADSEVVAGSVTATTTHFTTFAVLFVSGQGQVAGACDVSGFEACGGDLVGTWTITEACMTVPDNLFAMLAGQDSPLAACEGVVVDASVDIEGAFTFEADMTYSFPKMLHVEIAFTIPVSCVEGGDCSTISQDTAFTLEGDSCVGTMVIDDNDPDLGTYSTTATTFTTVKEGEDSGMPTEYCVSNEGGTPTARMKGTNSAGGTIMFTAQQQ